MKDEIKEILDYFENNVANNSIYMLKLDTNEAKLLLDYITNLQCDIDGYKTKYKNAKENLKKLQEENKEWSMIFDTFSKRPYAHKYLEEKRKELNNDKIVGLDSEMIYKDYYDYKSRNGKAREMIRFITYNSERPLTITELNKVYNILGGDDNE